MNPLAPICALALALSLAGPAVAQSSGMPGMDPDGKASPTAKRHRATGIVKSIDLAKGSVTIQHGPVNSLNWPSMTMGFAADDRKLLQNLKPGTQVEFEFFQQGTRYVIASIKVKESS